MGEVTRRRFLANTSLGIGVAVTGLAAAAGLEAAVNPRGARGAKLPASFAEPVILHVRDVGAGEVVVLAGTTEVVIHDRELVAHLVTAISTAAKRAR